MSQEMSPKDENPNAPSDKAVSAALDAIKQFCFDQDITVAVAESVSSGFLQLLFSTEAQAGLFFEGGITTYNCLQKERHLGIPREICDPCNGVDIGISQRMALTVCDIFDAKLGLSLTGYASPIPEQNIYDLFAFGTVALDGKVIFSDKLVSAQQDPDEIREDYAKILVLECAKALRIAEEAAMRGDVV